MGSDIPRTWRALHQHKLDSQLITENSLDWERHQQRCKWWGENRMKKKRNKTLSLQRKKKALSWQRAGSRQGCFHGWPYVVIWKKTGDLSKAWDSGLRLTQRLPWGLWWLRREVVSARCHSTLPKGLMEV